jgi:hypothetical protein
MPDNSGNLGMGEDEQDDSFAWLENLAAKQGATEGLLTTPDERREDEPDWVKQAKGLNESPAQASVQEQPAEMDIPADLAPESPAPSNAEDLGKSDEERDDSFSWLENLAAKQGATEGLLTTPDERREEEPDWVKQAKGANVPAVPSQVEDTEAPEDAATESTPQPTLDTGELGKSEEERDDSFSWLENLAAKQGATEGLLTKPEERREDEPEWVKQAKSSAVSELPVQASTESEPAADNQEDIDWMKNAKDIGEKFFDESMGTDEQEVESVSPVEDRLAEVAPASGDDDADAWLRTLEEPEPEPTPSSSSDNDDMMAWMEQEDAPAAESDVPENEADEVSDDLPGWLSGLDEDESKPEAVTGSDDLPSWMKDDTGELVAEPTKIEPTRPTDWAPEEQAKDEKVEDVEEAAPLPAPEPEPAPEPTPEPEPVPAPVAEKKPAPRKKEPKPAAPDPYKAPVTRKTTGMLEMPVDPILGSARAELTRSNIPGALETYGKLIKKGRFLEEVIYDLRDALYRYPVEVSIWQSLGDAYMRANQLQDALDAYTKAEELLR